MCGHCIKSGKFISSPHTKESSKKFQFSQEQNQKLLL
jgi:hypothetical protein